MDIAAHIGQLVLEQECVIIPGLGAFLTNYHAAEINTQQHSIQPPTRKLVFNSQLNSNDGLLAHYLSQRLDISYKSSLMLLDVFADYCKRDLYQGKQIAFGDLGILDRNIHNKLEFYPNTAINYNEDAFGLKPLSLKTIERKPDFSLRAPIRKTETNHSSAKVISLNSLTIRKVAAILIPLAVFISAVLYLPSFVTNNQVQQTSVFSFWNNIKSSVFSTEKLEKKTTETTKAEDADEISSNEDMNDKSDMDLADNENVSDDLIDSSEFIIKEQRFDIPDGQFHIICGSFSEKNRAEALVDQLKGEGFAAFVAGQSKSGTYRVSMQSFTNADDALRQINWIRNLGYDKAWILNKNF